MIKSRLPGFGTTIFTVMSQLAQSHGALNLSQGFPDFQPPARLLDLMHEHLQAGRNQYAPMPGVQALREQIAAKTLLAYGRKICPDTEVTVTSGATEALFSAINAFVCPGDEVIVFDPAYDSYDPAIRLAGGIPVHIPLFGPEFGIDWQRLRERLNDATRMIILNTPHNPTGSVLQKADLVQLADLVRERDIVLLGDEVYEHIIFDAAEYASLNAHAELAERSLIVSSFGKTFHMTGWKIGYCVAPAGLMQEFRKVHQFVQFCVATPMQYALADFLAEDPAHWQGLGRFYQARRDRFAELLAPSRFRFRPSAGTYFQLADYSAISDLPDTEFTRWMTVEKGIATIPISVFYAVRPSQSLVRFCFAKSDATLEQAAERLCAI